MAVRAHQPSRTHTAFTLARTVAQHGASSGLLLLLLLVLLLNLTCLLLLACCCLVWLLLSAVCYLVSGFSLLPGALAVLGGAAVGVVAVRVQAEFGPAVDLMSIPLPPNPAKVHRASRMVDGKWTDIGPTGMYGATGIP